MRSSSLEAHEAIKPKKESHYKEILKAMKKLGKESTSRIISTHTSLDYHSVARRLSEMEIKGMIKVVGRESTIKNRPLLWNIIK